MSNFQVFFTVEETAKLFKISSQTIYNDLADPSRHELLPPFSQRGKKSKILFIDPVGWMIRRARGKQDHIDEIKEKFGVEDAPAVGQKKGGRVSRKVKAMLVAGGAA